MWSIPTTLPTALLMFWLLLNGCLQPAAAISQTPPYLIQTFSSHCYGS